MEAVKKDPSKMSDIERMVAGIPTREDERKAAARRRLEEATAGEPVASYEEWTELVLHDLPAQVAAMGWNEDELKKLVPITRRAMWMVSKGSREPKLWTHEYARLYARMIVEARDRWRRLMNAIENGDTQTMLRLCREESESESVVGVAEMTLEEDGFSQYEKL